MSFLPPVVARRLSRTKSDAPELTVHDLQNVLAFRIGGIYNKKSLAKLMEEKQLVVEGGNGALLEQGNTLLRISRPEVIPIIVSSLKEKLHPIAVRLALIFKSLGFDDIEVTMDLSDDQSYMASADVGAGDGVTDVALKARHAATSARTNYAHVNIAGDRSVVITREYLQSSVYGVFQEDLGLFFDDRVRDIENYIRSPGDAATVSGKSTIAAESVSKAESSAASAGHAASDESAGEAATEAKVVSGRATSVVLGKSLKATLSTSLDVKGADFFTAGLERDKEIDSRVRVSVKVTPFPVRELVMLTSASKEMTAARWRFMYGHIPAGIAPLLVDIERAHAAAVDAYMEASKRFEEERAKAAAAEAEKGMAMSLFGSLMSLFVAQEEAAAPASAGAAPIRIFLSGLQTAGKTSFAWAVYLACLGMWAPPQLGCLVRPLRPLHDQSGTTKPTKGNILPVKMGPIEFDFADDQGERPMQDTFDPANPLHVSVLVARTLALRPGPLATDIASLRSATAGRHVKVIYVTQFDAAKSHGVQDTDVILGNIKEATANWGAATGWCMAYKKEVVDVALPGQNVQVVPLDLPLLRGEPEWAKKDPLGMDETRFAAMAERTMFALTTALEVVKAQLDQRRKEG